MHLRKNTWHFARNQSQLMKLPIRRQQQQQQKKKKKEKKKKEEKQYQTKSLWHYKESHDTVSK